MDFFRRSTTLKQALYDFEEVDCVTVFDSEKGASH